MSNSCMHRRLHRSQFQGTGEPGPICDDCGAVVPASACSHPMHGQTNKRSIDGAVDIICHVCGTTVARSRAS